MKPFHRRLLAGLAFAALASSPLAAGQPQPAGDGYTHTTITSFDKGEPGPVEVVSALLPHPDGHLYGTSYGGGKHRLGTVFRVAPDGEVTVLHHFAGGPGDGSNPLHAPLLLGGDGYLYGTTAYGGADDSGTVFRMKTDGQLKLLHNFGTVQDDGRVPIGGLVEGADGNLYGTTEFGGDTNRGTVYRLRHGTVKVLHRFAQACIVGCHPLGLVDGGDGHFYGITSGGGGPGHGTLYRITPAGQVEHLHDLTEDEGIQPEAPLARTADGELFGVTSVLGPRGHGTVFHLSRDGTVTVLAALNHKTGSPAAGRPLAASDGALYLATQTGGQHGMGAVVRVDRLGGTEIVHSFRGAQGGHSSAGLVEGQPGRLFGATSKGEKRRGRHGTVYQIDLPPGARAMPAD